MEAGLTRKTSASNTNVVGVLLGAGSQEPAGYPTN